MNNYLVTHALEQVWCAPDQDNQYIVKPQRITPTNGAINSYSFLWTQVALPAPGVRFHLYQIGQIHPALLNLPLKEGQWVSFMDVVDQSAVVCDLYDTTGIHLPLSQSWYTITRERALIIAVRRNPKIPLDFDNIQLYLRVYNNAYFASQRASALSDYLEAKGGLLQDTQLILALQTQAVAKQAYPGAIFSFVNGWWVDKIDLVSAKPGDTAEYVYDSSVIRTVDFKLSTLPTFESTLDKKAKYLLHYAGSDNDTIDYADDLELYLISKSAQRGVYVHRNAKDAMRMVTHRDYAVPTSHIHAYLNHFKDAKGMVDLDDLYLRLYVRNSGFKRKVISGLARLGELYKLPDNYLMQAMGGVNSNVEVWRASALEASAYCALMASNAVDVNHELVAQAYGYNTAAKLIGESVLRVSASNVLKRVEVPLAYQKRATVFEYDAHGVLLDWYQHTNSTVYIYKNTQTAYVEYVYGVSSESLDEYTTEDAITVSSDNRYRAYHNAAGYWQQLSQPDDYTVDNNTLTWAKTPHLSTVVRSDAKFLCYRLELTPSDGVLFFHLAQRRWVDNAWEVNDLEVPLGELDIFLNGRSLIEGLDYLVYFPLVVIINKTHLLNQTNVGEQVVVRFTGFCDGLLNRTPANEFGFVRNGVVSVDRQYDLRDQEVLRITLGGALKHKDELTFDESGALVSIHSQYNGLPYLIREVVVPVNMVLPHDTYTYRQTTVEVDAQISDYLTMRFPASPIVVNPVATRYQVFSPFFSALTDAVTENRIDLSSKSDGYDDDDMRKWCAPYLYLLKTDLINKDFQVSESYVVIHPHRYNQKQQLNAQQYKFLHNANRLYGNGRVELSEYYVLTQS